VGLARSDGSAETLEAAGAEVHLAFKHDPMGANDFAGAVAADLAAIQAMASALEGTGKPLVTTSGTLMLMFAGTRSTRPRCTGWPWRPPRPPVR
jgi:hypothetical protein